MGKITITQIGRGNKFKMEVKALGKYTVVDILLQSLSEAWMHLLKTKSAPMPAQDTPKQGGAA